MIQFLKKNKEIGLLGIMQVLIFTVLAFGQWHKTSDMYVYAGVFLLQVISCIVLYYLFRKIFRNIEEEKKQSMLLKQQKYAEEHKKVKAQLDNQLEDIKEQVSFMLKNLQMNAEKMSEKAFHEAVNEIISNSEQLYQVDFCDNKTIDAILYNKSLLAKSLHIPFDIQVQIPQQLNIAYVDLICVYANLLDNAIEATLETDQPSIRFALINLETEYIFVISNTFLEKGIPYAALAKPNVSTKGANRGIGLYNAHEIISRYNHAFLDTEIQDKIFVQRLQLSKSLI